MHAGAFRGCNRGCLANGAGKHATSSHFLFTACFSSPHGSLSSPATCALASRGTGDIVYSSLKVGIFDCKGNHVDFSGPRLAALYRSLFLLRRDYFRVTSLGGNWGLSIVCPVSNRILVLNKVKYNHSGAVAASPPSARQKFDSRSSL